MADPEKAVRMEEAPSQPVQDLDAQSPVAVKALAEKDGTEEIQYPEGMKLLLIMLSLYLAIFLTALDRTIIATAIPSITDQFDSFTDIGWYGSSFLLALCAFQLFFGRIYTFYSPKWVFLFVIGIFEVGSVVCAAAPNSTAFIVGRAIAGAGSAGKCLLLFLSTLGTALHQRIIADYNVYIGIVSGAIVILVQTVPLQKRPMYQGFIGAIFGIASVAGPLLGGVFTTDATWRWCFWINLPIGVITIIILVFILELPPPVKAGLSITQQVQQLDPLGTIVFLPGIVCLLLALQWGGSTYAWSNGRIIALLILAGILLTAFIAIQFWRKENATIPPRILKQQTVAAGFFYTTCLGSCFMIVVYYLPIWFQAIKGASAVHSGIMNLPLLLSLVFGSIAAGILVSKLGYYVPFMFASCLLMSIGTGLLTTFTTTTAHPKWIGTQVVFGFGLGMGMQQASIGAQTVLEKKDVPTGVSMMFFAQSFGGAVFVSVAQNVLSNRLIANLSDVPGFNSTAVADTGATDLRGVIGPKYIGLVIQAYNLALTDVFYIGVGLACVMIVGAAFMQWRSVKDKELH